MDGRIRLVCSHLYGRQIYQSSLSFDSPAKYFFFKKKRGTLVNENKTRSSLFSLQQREIHHRLCLVDRNAAYSRPSLDVFSISARSTRSSSHRTTQNLIPFRPPCLIREKNTHAESREEERKKKGKTSPSNIFGFSGLGVLCLVCVRWCCSCCCRDDPANNNRVGVDRRRESRRRRRVPWAPSVFFPPLMQQSRAS